MAASPNRTRWTIAVFALAFAPRVVYLAVARSPHDTYNWLLASSLLTDGSLSIGGVKTTAFEPLYPIVLAASRLLVGDRWWAVQIIQCALGAAGAVLLHRLASSLTGRPRVGVIAAALYAVYPLLVRYGGNISDATLMTVLVIGFAYAFTTAGTTRRAAGAGVCLGLTVLTRSMTLPLVALGAALLWRERGARAAAAMTAAAVFVVAPYALRNYALNGWMMPTRSGLNLFMSNCAYTGPLEPDHSLDLLEDYAQATRERREQTVGPLSPARERADDRIYTALALEHVAADPVDAIRLRLLHVWYFFSPTLVPNHDPLAPAELHIDSRGGFTVEHDRPRPLIDRVAYTVSYIPIVALALAGIWVRRKMLRSDGILWAVAATFVVVHAVYFPVTRYRIPIEFVALFYSAVAVDWASSVKKAGSDTNQPA